MKNIHVLPTDKPSRLAKLGMSNNLQLFDNLISFKTFQKSPQNIYITNDEEIKEGDWMIRDNENPIKVTKDFFWDFGLRYFKIILTTDQDLIKDGVQAIPDEFLEWFVKNPSCEVVEVKSFKSYSKNNYIIFIPKEEPKQKVICTKDICQGECVECNFMTTVNIEEPKQETLEEVAQKYGKSRFLNKTSHMLGFIAGAKWQQQQNKNLYSDEDMTKYALYILNNTVITPKEWFEQFKKK